MMRSLTKKMRRGTKMMLAYFLFYSGLLKRIRRLRARKGDFTILMYHHVSEGENGVGLPASVFRRQLAWASRNYSMVSLGSILRKEEAFSPKKPLLAVTFDDGHRDFLTVAYPLLKEKKIPVTLFAIVECLDKKPLWTEALRSWFKETSQTALELPFRGGSFTFSLENGTDRERAHRWIDGHLKQVDDEERCRLLEEIRRKLDDEKGHRTQEMLTWEELLSLSQDGVEIGSHTLSHPILNRLSPEKAKRQITESKQRLEERLLRKVDLFCYPNGHAEDFDSEIVRMVQEAGFLGACTTIEGKNGLGQNAYTLRRMATWERSLPLFACYVEGCFEFFARLQEVLKGGGIRPLWSAIVERFWCTRRLLILERPVESNPVPPRTIGIFDFGWLTAAEKGKLPLLQSDLTEKKVEERLKRGDRCMVVRKEGEIIGFLWVAEKAWDIWYIRSALTLRPDQVYLYNARTALPYRGRGVLPALRYQLEKAMTGGEKKSLLAAVHPENHISTRTLKKDGFIQTGLFLYQRRFFWSKRIWIAEETDLFSRALKAVRKNGVRAMVKEVRERFWSTRILLLFERPLRLAQTFSRQIGDFSFGWLEREEWKKVLQLQKGLTLERIQERYSRGDRCFVARREKEVVGSVWVTRRPQHVWAVRSTIPLKENQIYRYNARVDLPHRGRGLFPNMVHHLEKILWEEGIRRFLIAIQPQNDIAIRTNLKDGFVQTGYVFCRWRLFRKKTERVTFKPETPSSSFRVGRRSEKNSMNPVVVVGQGRTGLAADRLFGKRGIPLVKVADEVTALGRYSRYGDFRVVRTGDTGALLSLLKETRRRYHAPPVLVPTNDEAVRWFSEARERLEKEVCFLLPEKGTVETLLNKALFSREAARLGASVPKTRSVETLQDLHAIIREGFFPCVLKPSNGHFLPDTVAKALWISDGEQLKMFCGRLFQKEIPFVVQEAIPGEDTRHWSSAVYLGPEGEDLAVFTTQKIRQYPPFLGIASVCESRWNGAVASQAVSLLRKMNYVGAAEVEFKEDRDGTLKVIEVNPRLWIQHPLAARCGIDFAFLVYQGSLGLFPRKLGRQREGIRWVALDLDLLTIRQLFREGKVDFGKWLGAYRLPLEGALFEFRDPRPGLHRTKEMLGFFLKRRSSWKGHTFHR